MDLSQLNLWAVLVATLVSFGLGGLWYSPKLFGAAWMAETGITEKKAAEANMARTFGLALLANLVIAFNLAMFLGPERTLGTGILYGFLAGFGWVSMSFAVNDLFEQRSLRLFAINAGFHCVSFTLMGAIIGAWH
jgi:hypothetical protein